MPASSPTPSSARPRPRSRPDASPAGAAPLHPTCRGGRVPSDSQPRCARPLPVARGQGRCSNRVQGLWPWRIRAGTDFKTSGAPRSARKFCTRRRAAARLAYRRLVFLSGRFRFAALWPLATDLWPLLLGFSHQTTSPLSPTRSHLRMIWRARRRSQRFSEVRPQRRSRRAFSSRRSSISLRGAGSRSGAGAVVQVRPVRLVGLFGPARRGANSPASRP